MPRRAVPASPGGECCRPGSASRRARARARRKHVATPPGSAVKPHCECPAYNSRQNCWRNTCLGVAGALCSVSSASLSQVRAMSIKMSRTRKFTVPPQYRSGNHQGAKSRSNARAKAGYSSYQTIGVSRTCDLRLSSEYYPKQREALRVQASLRPQRPSSLRAPWRSKVPIGRHPVLQGSVPWPFPSSASPSESTAKSKSQKRRSPALTQGSMPSFLLP